MWARMKQKATMHGAGGTNGLQRRHAAIPLSLRLNLPPEYSAWLLTITDGGEVITLLKDLRLASFRCGAGDDGNIVRARSSINCKSQCVFFKGLRTCF